MTNNKLDMKQDEILVGLKERVDNYNIDRDNLQLELELGNFLRTNVIYSDKKLSKHYYQKVYDIIDNLPLSKSLFSRTFLSIKIGNEENSKKYFNQWLQNGLDEIFKNEKDYLKAVQFYINLMTYPEEYIQLAEKEITKRIFDKQGSTYHYFKGLHYFYHNDAENAKQWLNKTKMIDDQNWEAYLLLGDLYFQEEIWGTAIGYYLNVLQFKSQIANRQKQIVASLYFNIAWAYSKVKKYKEEESAYKECLKIETNYQYVNNNLGYCLYNQRKYKEALKYINISIRSSQDGDFPFWNKIRVLKALKDFRGTKKVLHILKKRNPKSKTIQKELNTIDALIENSNATISEIPNEKIAPVSLPKQKKSKSKQDYSFYKEKMLEDLLEERINKGVITFDKSLVMYNKLNKYGRQFGTDKGIIDLLTIDTKKDDLVVIELKKGKAGNEVVQQIQAYIDYLESNVAKQGQTVKGIICINKAKDELKRIVKENPQLELFEYSIELNQV